jgi:hypothetical protein
VGCWLQAAPSALVLLHAVMRSRHHHAGCLAAATALSCDLTSFFVANTAHDRLWLAAVVSPVVCAVFRRAVVPSCRQPGRLSTSSSQAWPDSSTPGSAVNAAAAAPAGPVSISEGGGYVAVEAGQARVAAVEDWMPVEATPAAAEVEMRHSSTDDSL